MWTPVGRTGGGRSAVEDERRATVTAVISKKGGVGKTTTAVNLSSALALAGRRVLIIDLDPNAGTSLSLGVPRRAFGAGAAGLLRGESKIGALARPTSLDGLDLIPASADLRSVEGDLSDLRAKELFLRRALAADPPAYDYVFLDCPSSLGLLTKNALAAADGYIVPAVPHFLAIEGLEHLTEIVDRLRCACGAAGRLVGIALTMVDYRTRLTRDNVGAIRKRFGNRVFAVEIRINVRLAEAPAFGQSIFQYSPGATGALAYELLREEFELRASRLPVDVEARSSTALRSSSPESRPAALVG